MKAQFPEKLGFLFKPKRYKILYGGRGGAKSWGVARAALITSAQRPLRWLCAREFQKSIADSVHQVLKDQIENLGLSGFYKVTDASITGANGSQFNFEGLRHNTSKIKSYEGVDRLWVEEAHTTSKASWELLIPTIRKDGSEIWVTFNPEFEEDDAYQRFIESPPEDAYVVELNWRDNPWFPSVLEKERLALQKKDPDAYDHVWEGHCRKWLEGAIYAKELRKVFIEKRVCDVAWEPMAPVYTAWDLGRTDDTAIWWYQVIAGEVRLIDFYASNGGSPSEYATQISGRECQIDLIGDDVVCVWGEPVAGLEHRREYQYARHWLPHDARAKTLAARGKSLIEQMASALDFRKMAIVPALSVEDGIQAVRTMFHRCWFDQNACDQGLKSLRRYQRELRDDGVSFSPHPKHDWTSHCFTGDTEVLTRYGTHQIINLPATGEVLTSCGWKKYRAPRRTLLNARLVAVAFTDGHTVKCTPDHLFLTASGWKSAASLTKGSLIRSSLTRSRSISMAVCTVFGRAKDTLLAAAKSCIDVFGSLPLAESQMDAISTIWTPYQQTILSEIWSASQRQNTYRLSGITNTASAGLMKRPESAQQRGTSLRPVCFGTADNPTVSRIGLSGPAWTSRALSAAQSLRRSIEAALRRKSSAPMFAASLTIESVKPLSERADVWDLTVPGVEHFSLKNGAIVHNSADAFRMLAVAWQHEAKPDEAKKVAPIRGLMVGSANTLTLDEMYALAKRTKREARI